jgi:transcriptional regulator with XRE-family HTH domain
MTGGKPLSKGDLWEEFATNLHDAYNSMRRAFQRSGLSQDELAFSLDADKGLISKRLHGQENLTFKTLSFMASALGCRLAINFVPYNEVAEVEQRSTAGEADMQEPQSKRNDATDDRPAEYEALRLMAA